MFNAAVCLLEYGAIASSIVVKEQNRTLIHAYLNHKQINSVSRPVRLGIVNLLWKFGGVSRELVANVDWKYIPVRVRQAINFYIEWDGIRILFIGIKKPTLEQKLPPDILRFIVSIIKMQ